jgi:hypothetical protein
MKLFVHHDTTGTIRSLIIVNAPEKVSLMLTPNPGLLVAEVEGVNVNPGAPDVRALREIGKSHKVVTPLPRTKLAKKI